MIANLTAEVFHAFIFGAAGLIGGGLLFESGKRYVKTPGSNHFKGKAEALPFFLGVLVLGWVLRHIEPVVEGIVYSIPPVMRLGIMIVGSMVLFNHSVDRFTYSDGTSVTVYCLGSALILLPAL